MPRDEETLSGLLAEILGRRGWKMGSAETPHGGLLSPPKSRWTTT